MPRANITIKFGHPVAALRSMRSSRRGEAGVIRSIGALVVRAAMSRVALQNEVEERILIFYGYWKILKSLRRLLGK